MSRQHRFREIKRRVSLDTCPGNIKTAFYNCALAYDNSPLGCRDVLCQDLGQVENVEYQSRLVKCTGMSVSDNCRDDSKPSNNLNNDAEFTCPDGKIFTCTDVSKRTERIRDAEGDLKDVVFYVHRDVQCCTRAPSHR